MGVKWQIGLSHGLVIGSRVVINGKCYGWLEVSSGVPQGSVLGPILFIIFINDIEAGICGNILKFADDTKLFCKVGSVINCAKLNDDLRKLYSWSEDWQMLFNLDKCKKKCTLDTITLIIFFY